jgi:glyoxylase-like metal-dependent hydrolase (beta-lactamase superfamily II)
MNKNIHKIKAGITNVYLIKNGEKSILIDAGNKNKAHKILKKIRKVGLKPDSIAAIIITHTHYDHVGSLPELKQLTNAKVIAHSADEESLKAGFTDLPEGTNPFFRFIVSLGRRFLKTHGSFTPAEPDILITEKYDLKDFDLDAFIIPTPGHTAGSVSVIVNREHAFVGDTAFNIRRKSVYPPFANDEKALKRSWETLLNTGVKHFWPGHGKMFSKEKFRKNYLKVDQKMH